ncbi:nuclear transport factor 2 family protein [Herbiconiux sp. P17]|uniref:nuclear transport factor 2 family protein n=1 Tax=Herbiconiux wuyangfengii TaxID=3342794 RepID=UPI0035BA38CB
MIKVERPSRPLRTRRTGGARLRALEDRAEIAVLIARYGPAADALDGAAITALWADRGNYSIGDTTLTNAAPDTVGALVDLAEHRGMVAAGCGHLLTPPDIRLAGDRATAVNHSVVLVHRGEGWQVARLSANRWEFRRIGDGWRIESRVNRLLDGDPAARELLGLARPERTERLQDD